MWWTSLTGWERCCPAPSFPQGIPGASLLAQKFPGAPADPQPNRQGPSTRIARRKAWYTSCDLASCQGPRDCDLFYMFFFCVFFMGKYVWWSGWSGLRLTNLQIWVMWSTHPFDPNCFDAFDPFLIGPELRIDHLLPYEPWACQLKSLGIFRPRLPIGPWIFLTNSINSPEIPQNSPIEWWNYLAIFPCYSGAWT